MTDQKISVKRTDSKKIFKDRMTNTAPSEDWIRGYELQSKDVSRNASMKRIFSDDPNLVLNPNWDKVVQVMSNGEVSSVPCLPVPTWTLIGDMIVDANVYGECAADTIDLSCAKQHKTELLKGDAFKIEIFNRMKDLFCYQLHIEDKTKVAEVLKEIMPDSYLNNLKQGSWVGSLQHTVEGKEFLSKQNNIGYLNKALKALKSPEFQELANRNEASKLNIEETQLILSTYKQVFFGKDEKSIVRNNPKALQNVHL